MKKKMIQRFMMIISSLCFFTVVGQTVVLAEKTDAFIGFQENTTSSDSASSSSSAASSSTTPTRDTSVPESVNTGKQYPRTGSVNQPYVWAGIVLLLVSMIVLIRNHRKKEQK